MICIFIVIRCLFLIFILSCFLNLILICSFIIIFEVNAFCLTFIMFCSRLFGISLNLKMIFDSLISLIQLGFVRLSFYLFVLTFSIDWSLFILVFIFTFSIILLLWVLFSMDLYLKLLVSTDHIDFYLKSYHVLYKYFILIFLWLNPDH